MIGLDAVYLLAGLMFGAFALQHALDPADVAEIGAHAEDHALALPSSIAARIVRIASGSEIPSTRRGRSKAAMPV